MQGIRLKAKDRKPTNKRWKRGGWFCALSLVSCFLIFSCTAKKQVARPREQGPSGLKIALFPFENHSGRRDAVKRIMPIVRGYLARSGYELLDDQDVNRLLTRHRIRRTGEISRKWARKLSEELGSDLILVGAVEVFNEVDQPQVGLSCRLVDSSEGFILWAESVGVAGDDFATFLGLGTVRSLDRLGSKAVERLFRTLGKIPMWEREASSGSRQHEDGPMVTLLPFENLSGKRAAGRTVSNVVITRLIQKSPYGVIEPGEVRDQLIHLRVRYLEAMGIETMGKLGREVGADYLLLGTVVDYREEVKGEFPPRVGMYVRMMDVERSRIVWAGNTTMTGNDFLIALDFGKIRSIIPLVKKASDHIIARMARQEGEKRQWRSAGNIRWRD